jgi:hypothetical protein
VRWIYYLLSDTTGRRVAIVFTMEQGQKERFKDADLVWVRSLEFISRDEQQDAAVRKTGKRITKDTPLF